MRGCSYGRTSKCDPADHQYAVVRLSGHLSGGGINIYDAGLDFNMCIYSYGMATEYETPENFKDAWNRPSIATDYMCNSIINSSSIKTHVKHNQDHHLHLFSIIFF